MSEQNHLTFASSSVQRPWDARLARRLVAPLKDTWVSPNHLTTLRLMVGLGAVTAFLPGTYLWSNAAAALLVLSNFLDHTDGELARLSGKTSRFGHWYDLASDALITVSMFVAIGVGQGGGAGAAHDLSPAWTGAVAGCAVALIFFLRMRIEDLAGRSAIRQAAVGGFESEDVLYLMPLCTLCDGLSPLLRVAAVGAPLFALWVIFDYRRVAAQALDAAPSSGVVR